MLYLDLIICQYYCIVDRCLERFSKEKNKNAGEIKQMSFCISLLEYGNKHNKQACEHTLVENEQRHRFARHSFHLTTFCVVYICNYIET